MNKENDFKFVKVLIVLICLIIVIIICCIMFFLNDNTSESDESNVSDDSNQVTNVATGNDVDLDLSDVWYQVSNIQGYALYGSLETYIQNYFEGLQEAIIDDFSVYSINEVYVFEQDSVSEYYTDGYVCNSDFSVIEEVFVQISVNNEGYSYDIDVLNYDNTWDEFISSKQSEISDDWTSISQSYSDAVSDIQSLSDDELDASEDSTDASEDSTDDDTDVDLYEIIDEESMEYSETEFFILDISDYYLINSYFTNFKIKVLLDVESSYDLIGEETKESMFSTLQDFEDNINTYINSSTSIEKYSVNVPILNESDDEDADIINSYVEYYVSDNNSNIYKIIIYGLDDYEILFE